MIKKLLLFILCTIPFFVSAGTYEGGRDLANKYMKENFDSDYSKYIISEDSEYGFNNNRIFSVSGFDKGGFINEYEYKLSTINGKNDSSWLHDDNGYWSLTEDEDDKIYVVGRGNYLKTNDFNNRITEYVRNKTIVTGKGTYSNPWVINKTYQVIIKANRNNLIESIYNNGKVCGQDSCEVSVSINNDAVFYLNFKNGYEFDSSEGGANLCSPAGYSERKLVISNILDDVECFFKVKEKDYVITFMPNGGVLSESNTKNVTYTKSYGTLPVPTKIGYTFAGWYTEITGGTKIDNTSTLNTPSNQTLYAHYTPNTYTVILNSNGGSVSTSNISVTYDSTYSSLPTPIKTGYTFTGWYTALSGGTQVTASTKVTTASSHTLYARYAPNTYIVTLNSNGGSVSTSNISVKFDSTYSSLPTSTRPGYAFNGWYTALSGGTQVTASTKVTTASNHTLYAHWTLTDTTPPTCSLRVSGTTITGSYSDAGGSGVAYYGYNSSMTGSSSATKSISGTGTYTFYVKDGVGNKSSCSINVISTTSNTNCSSWGEEYCASWGEEYCASWGSYYCSSWGKYYCDDGGMTACGNKTCCASSGGTWKRDCNKYTRDCNKYTRDCNRYTRDCNKYTTTYSCASGYTKINDSYCYK